MAPLFRRVRSTSKVYTLYIIRDAIIIALILKYRRRSQEGEERIRDAATRRRGETQRRSNKKEMRDSETQQQEGEERLRDAATRGRGET